MTKPLLEKELEFAIKIAKEAGRIIMGGIHTDLKSKWKDLDNLVTDVDYQVDNYIRKKMKESYPDDGLLTEESKDNLARLSKERVWIVDPLDGSGVFERYAQSKGTDEKLEFFGTLIGLSVNNGAVLGVAYFPARDELFYAVRSRGAYKVIGGSVPKRIAVNQGDPKNPVIEFAGSMYENPLNSKIVESTKARRQGFGNVFGYCVTAIADGQIQGYAANPEGPETIGEWDLCAPSVILEGAGGIITNFRGEKFRFNNPNPYMCKGVCAQAYPGLIRLA